MIHPVAVHTSAGGLPVPAGAVPGNPVHVYLRRLGSPLSQATMLDALARLADGFSARAGIPEAERPGPYQYPWWNLRYPDTVEMRAILMSRFEPATVAKYLAALRGVFKECWRLGLMSIEDMTRAGDVKAPRGSKELTGRHVDSPEIRKLFDAAAEQKAPLSTRNLALLAAVFGGGLRRAEIAALDLGDFSAREGTLHVRKGKGQKERIVDLPGRAVELIGAWTAARGNHPGQLFVPVRSTGRVAVTVVRTRHLLDGHSERIRVPAAMTAQAIYMALKDIVQRAGIDAVSPHDGRRTWIGNLLDAGVDISTVKEMAGHASVQTTGRYDRRGGRARKAAAAKLDLP